jgi:hypothetical protein
VVHLADSVLPARHLPNSARALTGVSGPKSFLGRLRLQFLSVIWAKKATAASGASIKLISVVAVWARPFPVESGLAPAQMRQALHLDGGENIVG